MNKRKAPVILSWLLLLFFAAGQIIVFAHQHHAKYSVLSVHQSHSQQQIIHEKCNFCDQMHHSVISIVAIPNYGSILTPVFKLYSYARQHYLGNALVHADGLSPPVLV